MPTPTEMKKIHDLAIDYEWQLFQVMKSKTPDVMEMDAAKSALFSAIELALIEKNRWVKVSDQPPPSEPGSDAVEFFTPDLRNPTSRWIGVLRDGKWMSCGFEVVNVTHWRELSTDPV